MKSKLVKEILNEVQSFKRGGDPYDKLAIGALHKLKGLPSTKIGNTNYYLGMQFELSGKGYWMMGCEAITTEDPHETGEDWADDFWHCKEGIVMINGLHDCGDSWDICLDTYDVEDMGGLDHEDIEEAWLEGNGEGMVCQGMDKYDFKTLIDRGDLKLVSWMNIPIDKVPMSIFY